MIKPLIIAIALVPKPDCVQEWKAHAQAVNNQMYSIRVPKPERKLEIMMVEKVGEIDKLVSSEIEKCYAIHIGKIRTSEWRRPKSKKEQPKKKAKKKPTKKKKESDGKKR